MKNGVIIWVLTLGLCLGFSMASAQSVTIKLPTSEVKSDAEIEARNVAFFTRYDLNSDSKVSRIEFKNVLKKANPNSEAKDEGLLDIAFDHFDKNGDGYIVKYEFAMSMSKAKSPTP